MANLNVFKNISANLETSNTVLYTAPNGYTSIILMAQVANINTAPATVVFGWNNNVANTELVYNYSVPTNEAANLLTGKLVLQNGHSIYASSDTADALKITFSILESLN